MLHFCRGVIVVFFFFLSAIPAQANEEKIIAARSGDTFDKIALRELGSAGFGRLLAEYNNASYLGAISANNKIRIPVPEIIESEYLTTLFAKGESLVLIGGNTGKSERARSGSEIFVNDHILTGSNGFVSMQVPSGSVINVQPNSLVALLKLQCPKSADVCDVELEALEGELSTRVRQRVGQPTTFRIKTPHATAAVRGTTFDVGTADSQLLIGVTEGAVDLTAGSALTELPGGLGVKTLAGQAPGTPVPLLQAASYKRINPRISVEDSLSWHRVRGAVSYTVAIGRDAAGTTTEYKVAADDTVHQIQDLPASSYHLQVRAIDGDGLKGFRATTEINVVALDESKEGPLLSRSEENGDYIVGLSEAGDESEVIEIQVSQSDDFSEVTTVDVSGDGGVLYQSGDVPAYARGRYILNESTVGKFGPVVELPAR